MAGQTLGTPSKVGMVMPLKWWFDRQKAPQQLPDQVEQPATGPSDEPPTAAKVAPAAAPAPRKDEDGGGLAKSRASLRDRADAGVVDNATDFGKAVLQGPSGPIGAMAFMGRLFGGRALPGGFPGSNVNNANLDPATAAKMKGIADAAAASPQQPPAAAAIFKPGEDFLRNKKLKPTPVAGPGGGGGGGARTGGAIGSNAGRRGF